VDGNGDGIGDFAGLTERLAYLDTSAYLPLDCRLLASLRCQRLPSRCGALIIGDNGLHAIVVWTSHTQLSE
jgi:hypothetical protein